MNICVFPVYVMSLIGVSRATGTNEDIRSLELEAQMAVGQQLGTEIETRSSARLVSALDQ